MPRPAYAFAVKRVTIEFDSGYASTCTETIEQTFFASLAGAHFAERKFGAGDETIYGEVQTLRPGKVYNHQANRWEPGLTYERALQTIDRDGGASDEIPF